MAIQSFEKSDKNKTKSCSKSSSLSSAKLMKFDCGPFENTIIKNNDYVSKEHEYASPYLSGDRIQLLSRVTEKKVVHKRTSDFMSSFPLAVNIYKASSDQFRLPKRRNKKVKKSVLTLPNEQAPLPQTCTVSDMNDSECFNDNENENKPRPKKKRPIKNRKHKEIKTYDRDAKYCSQLDIDLDKSSTEIINTGAGKSISKKCSRAKNTKLYKSNFDAHDVWSMLRNVNSFGFRSTPSQDSFISDQKRKSLKKGQNKAKDARYIETCRTEEFAYISSFVDHQNSQTSLDRVTVIDKQDGFQEMCKDIHMIDKQLQKPKLQSEKILQQTIRRKSNKKGKKQNVKRILDGKKSDKLIINHEYSDFEFTSKEHLSIEGKVSETVTKINNIMYANCKEKSFEFKPDEDYDQKLIGSDQSDRVSKKESMPRMKNTLPKLYNKESQVLSGITKVVVNNGQNILLSKPLEATKRKSRFTTIKPRYPVPKLTQTEIRRRLALLKFPIIILDKDQVSSTFELKSYEPPQFDGLDKHMWPFMKNWSHKDQLFFSEIDGKDKKNIIRDHNSKKNNIFENNDTVIYNRSVNNMNSQIKENNVDNTNIVKTMKDSKNQFPIIKEKPITKVKDKMLQLIRKKSSNKSNLGASNNRDDKAIIVVPNSDIVSVCTTQNVLRKESHKSERNDEEVAKENSFNKSYQWAKRKWASDFIDNVIRKIKNGAYFSQDDKQSLYKTKYKTDESAQTESFENSNYDQDSQVTVEDRDIITTIPGLDNGLTHENNNQILVKHCITTLVNQFDVSLKPENNSLQIKKSFSYIPFKDSDNTKKNKCKAAIFNGILPTEICSILPSLMRKVLLLPASFDRVDSYLPSINELSQCESHDTIKPLISINAVKSSITRSLDSGNFAKDACINVLKNNTIENVRLNSPHNYDLVENILVKVRTDWILVNRIEHFIMCPWISLTNSNFKNNALKDQTKTCTALQPYLTSNKKIYPAFKKFSFLQFVEILGQNYLNINVNAPFIKTFKVVIGCCNNNNKLFVNMESKNVDKTAKIPYKVTNITVDPLFNGFKKRCDNENTTICDFNKENTFEFNKKVDKRKTRGESYVYNQRNKRKGFVKLYKKCKSMSSLPNEKSSTSLNKITTLDEFFNVLGSAKTLASVLDGNLEKKIISSIHEMKNWMTDITPRQALLILLLANKKDTSNIMRYRPIILQGIAVNRITRATELDMEIEVLETENINIRSRYEGITYLKASAENQDSLLEELCWIAKTTASDYQKPFDASSERHLKSLLEKRKKLNPSYLRVMARYVGLGLLKPSK